MEAVVPVPMFSKEEAFKNNPNLKKSDLQIIRDWLGKQPHLPEVEDIYLMLFLHSNYYQLEPTKTTIENFYTVRTHVPEFFSQRDPFLKELREQFNVIASIPLKGKSKDGYQLVFGAVIDPDPSHYSIFDSTKGFFMITEMAVFEAGLTNGIAYVVDVKNFSLGHIGRLNLMAIKKFLYYVQEAAPIRLKHIHILNSNVALETLLSMAKPFMRSEFFQMIKFHHSLESLKEYLSIDLLPNEVGGKAGTIKDLMKEEIKRLDDNREWFLKEEATKRVNESLRVGKAKSSNDLFGVEGSFKKLDID